MFLNDYEVKICVVAETNLYPQEAKKITIKGFDVVTADGRGAREEMGLTLDRMRGGVAILARTGVDCVELNDFFTLPSQSTAVQ